MEGAGVISESDSARGFCGFNKKVERGVTNDERTRFNLFKKR